MENQLELNECVICYEAITHQQPIIYANCQHGNCFHAKCISKCSSLCPLCRSPIYDQEFTINHIHNIISNRPEYIYKINKKSSFKN